MVGAAADAEQQRASHDALADALRRADAAGEDVESAIHLLEPHCDAQYVDPMCSPAMRWNYAIALQQAGRSADALSHLVQLARQEETKYLSDEFRFNGRHFLAQVRERGGELWPPCMARPSSIAPPAPPQPLSPPPPSKDAAAPGPARRRARAAARDGALPRTRRECGLWRPAARPAAAHVEVPHAAGDPPPVALQQSAHEPCSRARRVRGRVSGKVGRWNSILGSRARLSPCFP